MTTPTSRPVIYGTQGVISSGHYLTSMAGMRMLLSGGNAFDAIVAAGFAAAVTEPIASYSLGAEGVFMLYHADSGDLLSLSGQGTAPNKTTVEWYRDQGHDAIPTGPGPDAHLSFTVPGVVAAFLSMLERYGTKSVGEVLAPSIQYAGEGIPNYEYMLRSIGNENTRKQWAQYPPGGTDVFYDNGAIPQPGSLLVQPGMAGTLEKLVEAEKAAEGDRAEGVRAARECFYEGEVARTIAECSERVGGILDMESLADYEAKYETPIKTSFLGHEVHGQRTWTQGAVLMQSLNILENFDLQAMGHNSTAYIHTVSQALNLAFADRQTYYGDPDFADVPIEGLLSKEYARERAKLIDSDRAFPETPEPGDPWRYSRPFRNTKGARDGARNAVERGMPAQESSDEVGTTHISVIDGEGNMVAATPSGGSFSKSVFFPELGYALSTRMEMLNFIDGHPNRLEPGKRPRTTLINFIVSKDGVPVMTVGCPGGDHQAQANLQLILNSLLWGMNPQAAVEAPRFASNNVVNSFYPHSYFPGQLAVEHAIPQSTRDELAAMGHEVIAVDGAGVGATVSTRDPDTGVLASSADPRRACYALSC
ncbi:MAG: gamma-glutamyltransferase family protein [Chloroflexi bacterium]|nr:gamma-glutamyltransferase family protein [Chloroflexota bacterium]MYK60646.1 gamma-glutamyltransferase family protein [Chloroflexota bacterium]